MENDQSTSNLQKYVKRFDYFGVTIPFRMDGKRTYQSSLNGVVFIIYIVGVLFYCAYNFINYASFTDYTYIYSETKEENPPESSFVVTKTAFAISLTKNSVVNNDLLKYLNLIGEATHSYRSSEPNIKSPGKTCNDVPCKNKITLNLTKKCVPNDFYIAPNNTPINKLNNYSYITLLDFDTQGLKDWNCIDLSIFNISGQYQSQEFNYYSFEVSLKSGLNATQIQEIKELTKKYEFKLEFKFIDSNFNINNMSQYVDNFINSDFLNIDYAFTKKKNFYFEKSDLKTDTNPFMQGTDEKNYTIVSLGPKEEYFMFRGEDRIKYDVKGDNSNDGMVLAKIYLRSSPIYRKIKLVYYKFTEFIADTSSLAQMVLVGLFFFCTSINEMLSFKMMMKKTLKFKSDVSLENHDDINYFRSLFIDDIKKARKNKRNSLAFNVNEMPDIDVEEFNNEDFNGQQMVEMKEGNLNDIRNDNQILSASVVGSRKSSSNNSQASIHDSERQTPDMVILNENKQFGARPQNNDDKVEQSVLRGKSIIFDCNNPDTSNIQEAKPIDDENLPSKSDKLDVKTEKDLVSYPTQNFSEKSKTRRSSEFFSNGDEEIGFSNIDVVKKVFFNFFCAFCKNCDAFKKTDNKDEEYSLFKKGKHQLTHYMDFLTYIKKMQELDILKYVLLDNDQRKIFNFVSRPSIDTSRIDIYTRIQQKYDTKTTDEFDRKEIDSVHSSFQKLSSKKDLNTNKKLIQLAELEIDYIASK